MRISHAFFAAALCASLALLAPAGLAGGTSSYGVVASGWVKQGLSGQVYVWQSGSC